MRACKTLKLFGLGVALLLWVVAAGNSGLSGWAQTSTPLGDRLVWFTPNMFSDSPPQDAFSLFEPGAPWPTVKSSIQAFKFYIDLPNEIRNFPFAQAVQALKDANIAIAVEAGGLRDFAQCRGARMAEIELAKISAITKAGGQLSHLALDFPFAHSLNNGENSCRFTIERAIAELLEYIKAVRRQHPSVKIGLIEPVPWYTVGDFPNHPGARYGDLPQLLDTALSLLSQGGETLNFFHADSPYDYNEGIPGGQGWTKLKALQDFVRSRGLRFGLIYNSDRGGSTSDELFFRETLIAKAKFALAGGDPDDIILQSWYWHPHQWLPEDQPYTYTYLVREFLKPDSDNDGVPDAQDFCPTFPGMPEANGC